MTAGRKRVLIVDDEPAARAQLRDVIDNLPCLVVIAEECDGAAAIQAITDHAPDIVFLDIDMPGVDGFQVASATAHLLYQLVFVTAHHQHALQAFDTHAIDYLLKPARPSVVEKCLSKIMRQQVLTLDTRPDTPKPANLVLMDSGTSRVVSIRHVLYVEGLGRYRRIHLSTEGTMIHKVETLLSDTTLDEFTEQLEEAAFIRVHRSYLVNLSLVTALKSLQRRHDLILEGVARAIPVARSRVKALREALENN